jgi:ABC-type hemin transport system substrate-binding protein
MNRSTPWRITVAVWMVWAAAGCGLEEPGGTDTAAPGPVEPPRIVSLSPALSRTLVDLGLADHVVGRTAYCASLDPAIPIVGDLYELDYERLIRLEPTHVLLQPASATGVDPQLRRLAEERGWTIGAWTS